MFINSKKSYEITEGDRRFSIAPNFIGNIPDWVAGHWLVQAAIRDGSIATPENTADGALESADRIAGTKAGRYDIRPEAAGDKEQGKADGKRGKEKD